MRRVERAHTFLSGAWVVHAHLTAPANSRCSLRGNELENQIKHAVKHAAGSRVSITFDEDPEGDEDGAALRVEAGAELSAMDALVNEEEAQAQAEVEAARAAARGDGAFET